MNMPAGGLAFPSTTAHWLAVALGLLLYVLTARIKRERRPATAAVAWVLGIIALPYVVVPAYVMFGARKLTRTGTFVKLPASGAHWAERLLASFAMAPAEDARIRLHRDGSEALAAWRELVMGARERLDIATFILGNDRLGRDAIALLRAAAQRGVRVRLLLDGVGALLGLPPGTLKDLRAAGVDAQIFRPPFARVVDGPRNLRNHRKLTIADHGVLWAGGRNLAEQYFTGSASTPAWRDLSFDLEGPIAEDAAAQFEADWLASGGRVYGPVASEARAAVMSDAVMPENPRSATGRVQFVPSGPDQVEDTVHALIVDACYRAERRLLAVTPYFLPDQSLETALRLAARRGVQVTLYLPQASNHRLADFARSRSLRELSAAGAQIRLLPFMVHAKAIVVDDVLAISGSVNLDLRSLLLNHESAVAFYDSAQIAWFSSWIDALFDESMPFDASPPGLMRDFAEGLVLTVAFQL
jgi:cardiolipin synthase